MSNVNFIGAPEGAIIHDGYDNPNYIMELVSEGLDKLGYSYAKIDFKDKKGSEDKGFNSVHVGSDDNSLHIEGIYDNGIVYRITKIIDCGVNKYDTLTGCDVIVDNDGVTIVTTVLDNRIPSNKELDNRLDENNGLFIVCNQKEAKAAKDNLGNQIEMKIPEVKSFFPSKREQIKNKMRSEKLELLKSRIELSSKVISAAMSKTK